MTCPTCHGPMLIQENWSPEACCGPAVELVTICPRCTVSVLPLMRRPDLTQERRNQSDPPHGMDPAVNSSPRGRQTGNQACLTGTERK
jgi:hypothetical protein